MHNIIDGLSEYLRINKIERIKNNKMIYKKL